MASSEPENVSDYQRSGESESEKLDRNWNEILQELRVTQTGTQILTGFLLTLAFQTRFKELSTDQVALYLVLVVLAVSATALGLIPVSLHRALFRQGRKDRTVRDGDRLLRIMLAVISVLLVGVVAFLFDVVWGRVPALVAGGIALMIAIAAWLAVLRISRRSLRRKVN